MTMMGIGSMGVLAAGRVGLTTQQWQKLQRRQLQK